jgi:hypothetical protein
LIDEQLLPHGGEHDEPQTFLEGQHRHDERRNRRDQKHERDVVLRFFEALGVARYDHLQGDDEDHEREADRDDACDRRRR